MSEETVELRITNVEKDVEKLKSTINGNGKMGLKTKVTLIFWGHWPLGIAIGAIMKGYLEKLVG